MPFSSAVRRAMGLAFTPPGNSSPVLGWACGAATAGSLPCPLLAAGAGSLTSALAGPVLFTSSLAASAPSALTSAIGAPTGTTAPTSTSVLVRTSLAVDSISMVALSLSISARTSPDLTGSPTFLTQLTKVPSVMSSPNLGITMVSGIQHLFHSGNHLLRVRQRHQFNFLSKWQWHIQCSHSLDWSVHVVKHVLLQLRGDLAANREVRQRFLDNHAVICLLEALEHEVKVQWTQPAQVHDLSLNALLCQNIRCL